ncbi:hypothetical protein [Thioflexithrix psekupsensis]|uniref:Uncharacterized protein n=1 Tax=Thioflexithrix psekupsensis TaxID=1570016 RepID=A0A251X7Z5_9GAMM|nr:hypothetical protein [Thioflexithrix psekupsensis]OUD14116.1 hypothetical protein TPSD3_07190 [Thioflexithrix psekupsensis]
MDSFITAIRLPIALIAIILILALAVIHVSLTILYVLFFFIIETIAIIIAVPFLAIFKTRTKFAELISTYPQTIKLCFKENEKKLENYIKRLEEIDTAPPVICLIPEIWNKYPLSVKKVWKWVFNEWG